MTDASSQDAAPLDPDLLARAADLLRGAQDILVITGAGISADSGLPTYRGVAGLYTDGRTDEGVPIEEALSGRTLLRDPTLAWRHIARIEAACRGATPNRGHRVLARLEASGRRVTVLTQNVDGLHLDAGSQDVIEIHGTVRRLRCDGCGWKADAPDFSALSIPPACPRCGAVARPDVVLFGELLPPTAVRRMQAAVGRRHDLVLSIGTTSVFPYIAEPVWQARVRGTPSIEINPTETEVSAAVDLRLPVGAAAALGALWDAIS